MTTAGHARDFGAPRAATVSIAGVPWPRYKVVALVVGLMTFVVVGIVTAAAAPAVLTSAAVATVVWIGGASLGASHR
ncbi:hypothetical protein [Mycobacterium sp. SMC-4]|uniref:hypothetical protein n=1 Tax=Mycobacterium sp. SMC-4 TaxID=2857059 RepID=UPI0021B33C12|nr:hypothetical protein [Mycobacterium sp. SMC-4]UXA20302.1 hypothetical protein KXD98_12440 [Mycobacterium sp. SMC-4]